LSARV